MAQKRFFRRSRAARYLSDGARTRSVNWKSVALAAIVFALAVIGVVFFVQTILRDQANPAGVPSISAPASESPGAELSPSPTAQPTPSVQPGTDEANPLDLSQDSEKVVAQGNSVNVPGIYGNHMVFSAGSGSINSEPVLKTLYLYNLESKTDAEIAQSQIKDGEIYDSLINEEYIVWLDTDQSGHHSIYFMMRHDEDGLGVQLVKDCENAIPKLRLSRDSLIFTEQYIDPETNEKEETLYHVDLVSGENVALPNYTESIFGHETTYAVSAPDIYGDEVIWAAPDPNQTPEDRMLNGEKSLVYFCELQQLVNDDYQPGTWEAGMYVHEPITNGRAWAWIDRNKAPDSTLWVKFGDQVTRVSSGVTSYCFGDDMLVYGKEGSIWVYFYETAMYGRVTREGERGILPIATGRKIVWFDRTNPDGKDQLMIVYIP